MTPLLKTGIVGTVVTAICCFTPLLVWLLTAVGLAGTLGWIDRVLLPLLALFVLLTAIGYIGMKRKGSH